MQYHRNTFCGLLLVISLLITHVPYVPIPIKVAEGHRLTNVRSLAPFVPVEHPQSDINHSATITSTPSISAVRLSTRLNRYRYVAGDKATLTASLISADGVVPLTGPITAVLANASQSELQQMTLHDDGLNGDDHVGDGIYSIEFVVPTVAEMGASLNTVDVFANTSRMSFHEESLLIIQPFVAQLGEAIAVNEVKQDGFISSLSFTMPVTLGLSRNLRIQGALIDPAGALIALNQIDAIYPAGPANMTLAFDGKEIRDHHLNGALALTHVILTDLETMATLAYRDIAYTTTAYSFTEFALPPLQIASSGDSLVGMNSHELFSTLQVTVAFKDIDHRHYFWAGTLLDKNGNQIEYVDNEGQLSLGAAVTLSFDGRLIRRGGVDGPYSVSLSVWHKSDQTDQIRFWQAHLTQGYNTSLFAGFPDLVIDGAPIVVSVTKPGGSVFFPFFGAMGQTLSIELEGDLHSGDAWISIQTVEAAQDVPGALYYPGMGQASTSFAFRSLPYTGQYQVKLALTISHAGTYTFSLYDSYMPINTTVDGWPLAVKFPHRNLRVRVNFSGIQGQMLNLKINAPSSPNQYLELFAPDGQVIGYIPTARDVSLKPLPMTGNYILETSPEFLKGDVITFSLVSAITQPISLNATKSSRTPSVLSGTLPATEMLYCHQ